MSHHIVGFFTWPRCKQHWAHAEDVFSYVTLLILHMKMCGQIGDKWADGFTCLVSFEQSGSLDHTPFATSAWSKKSENFVAFHGWGTWLCTHMYYFSSLIACPPTYRIVWLFPPFYMRPVWWGVGYHFWGTICAPWWCVFHKQAPLIQIDILPHLSLVHAKTNAFSIIPSPKWCYFGS